MAIKTSGSLAMSEIAAEFGDATPYSLSEFYRGGGKVPNVSQNNAVPLSGAIAIGNFYGAVNQWTTSWSTAWNTSVTTSQSTTTSWSTSWTTSSVITEGPFYNVNSYYWYTYNWTAHNDFGSYSGSGQKVIWNGIDITTGAVSGTINGYTYYRGSFVYNTSISLPQYNYDEIGNYYQIYRIYIGSVTTSATTSQNTSTAWSTAWSTSQTTSKLTP